MPALGDPYGRKAHRLLLMAQVGVLLGMVSTAGGAEQVATLDGYTLHFEPVKPRSDTRVFTTFSHDGSSSEHATFHGSMSTEACGSLCKAQSSCIGFVFWTTRSETNRTKIPHCTGLSSLGSAEGQQELQEKTWSFGLTVR